MKIIVLSDSHGSSISILRALRAHPDAEAAIFLGDGAADFFSCRGKFPDVAFMAVSGNCDIGYSGIYDLRAAEQITLEGVRLFFCHGDTYSVKSGTDRLVAAARAREADIALFGHTHTPIERYIPEDGEGRALYLVNPGSVGLDSHTYAIITIRDGSILISHGKV